MDKKNVTAPMPVSKLERADSLEEPKTLTEAELAFLRAALSVINSHTPEEATRIFLGGQKTATKLAAKKPESASKAEK